MPTTERDTSAPFVYTHDAENSIPCTRAHRFICACAGGSLSRYVASFYSLRIAPDARNFLNKRQSENRMRDGMPLAGLLAPEVFNHSRKQMFIEETGRRIDSEYDP